ncbi:hypothetical protein FOTG_16016 [Fusarium oxysporum f. sp. vasinfectum 25433]|uniref:Uncharacterized protein n=1 Tax=Fusarium oxysporum f. sp. vasinfectum 25433 TaxID=1089449 RepID=X0KPZ8_FUSOX|nr:hypothetical protein FOTG_16016 [Fusarium oxysporum f. sp. vasinfectum 25433]
MELEDLFYYDSWRIVVCRQCRVVPQTNIARHIRRHHNATRAFKVAAIKLFERSLDHLPLIRDTDEICKNVRRCRPPIRFGSLMFFTMEFVVYFVKMAETGMSAEVTQQ